MTSPDTGPALTDEKLTAAERKLVDHVITGTIADVRATETELNDPTCGADWGKDRTVRAELLAGLLTADQVLRGGRPRAVKLCGARITGPLILEARALTCPLLLQDCYVDEPVDLSEATAPSIRLPGCQLPALTARQLRATGDVDLAGTFGLHGGVNVSGAQIGGHLILTGARVENDNGPALNGDWLTIEDSLDCQGFHVRGEVRLFGAHIRGMLSLIGANLANENGPALAADGLTVSHMLCRNGFTARGEVRLIGARIAGQLSMIGATIANEHGLALNADGLTVGQNMLCIDGFTARGEVCLSGARIGGILDLTAASLANEHGQALTADGLTVDRSLYCKGLHTSGEVRLNGLSVGQDMLCKGLHTSGEVSMRGARIGRQLYLSEARLENEHGPALSANRLTVGQDMLCQDRFTARGEVDLSHSQVGGVIDLSGASLVNEHGPALTADGLTVGQGMYFRDGFTARGEVSLSSAHIGGRLDFTKASLENEHGPALTAVRLTVGQDMFCQEGFRAVGGISLHGARIGGMLSFVRANLTNKNGPALTADVLTVGQDMLCWGFTSHGEVRLLGAHIGEQLSFIGANLEGEQLSPDEASMESEHGPALIADGLTVGQDMLCQDRFTTRGEIRLSGACIGGQLDLRGASLSSGSGQASDQGQALTADRLTVGQDVLCRDGFSARGEICLVSARIGGQLDLREATLANPGGIALNLETTSAGSLVLLPKQRPEGTVNLAGGNVGHLIDDPATWPMTMHLRGFVYDILENDQVSVRQRLGWLTRNADGYVPQVYDQLSAAYRNAGRMEAARRVAIAKQRRRRSPLNPFGWLLYATVGYGYRTWLAGAWLTAFLAAGTWVFSRAHMIAIVTHPPAFHPFAYTADVILPIVNLGQKTAWQPQGTALYWSWALTGAGWVLTTAVVAGLTGVLKRE